MVKDEAPILPRLYESVWDVLDSYVLLDTGSSDNTIQLTKDFFERQGIPGHVYHVPWENFGESRTRSVQFGYGESEYLYLLDADYVHKDVDETWRQNKLTESHYEIKETGGSHYYRTHLVKSDRYAFYVGVTHEYVDSISPENKSSATRNRLDCFYIDHIGDGKNKTNKFRRDIMMLTKHLALTKNQMLRSRYCYYLGDSFFNLGQYQEAMDFYLKRISFGGFEEEVYFARQKVGLCKFYMNKPHLECFMHLLDSYIGRPQRLEALNHFVRICNEQGYYRLACAFGTLALRPLNWKDDYLFLDWDIHDWEYLHNLTNACAKVDEYAKIGDQCLKQIEHERLYPAEKQKLIDSTRKIVDAQLRKVSGNKKIYQYEVSKTSTQPFSNNLCVLPKENSRSQYTKVMQKVSEQIQKNKTFIEYVPYLVEAIRLGIDLGSASNVVGPLQILMQQCYTRKMWDWPTVITRGLMYRR